MGLFPKLAIPILLTLTVAPPLTSHRALAHNQPTQEPSPAGTGFTPPKVESATPAAAAMPFGPQLKEALLKEVSNIVRGRAFAAGVDFNSWPDRLAKYQARLDAAATEQAFTETLNQAFREFGISHMHMQTPRAAAQRNKTSMIGIGVSLAPQPDGLQVLAVVPNAPAANAGIQPGETITKVDGQKADVPDGLRGEEGTTVTVTVRSTDGVEREVVITRREFSTTRTDTLTWINDNTAVLKVHTFAAGYSKRRIADLIKEASEKAKYLIVDLRDNGGGAVENLNQLLSLLLPPGTAMGTNVGRPLASKFQQETGGDATDAVAIANWAESKVRTRARVESRFEGKIAVLINRGSASASEIAAAALRDCADARIIGSPTAGAVLVSTFVKLPGNFAMQVPLSEYVTIKGQRLEGNPVKPDVEVASAPRSRRGAGPAVPASEDLALQKAVEVLHTGLVEPIQAEGERAETQDNKK